MTLVILTRTFENKARFLHSYTVKDTLFRDAGKKLENAWLEYEASKNNT